MDRFFKVFAFNVIYILLSYPSDFLKELFEVFLGIANVLKANKHYNF